MEFDYEYSDQDFAHECRDSKYALKYKDSILVSSGDELAAWLVENWR